MYINGLGTEDGLPHNLNTRKDRLKDIIIKYDVLDYDIIKMFS